MAITAAAIEANGWVLRVTLTGAVSSAIVAGYNAAYATPGATPDTPAQWATNFGAYALNPNGASPALVLAATSNGFVQAGGVVAASGAVARSLVATKPLRKPVDATPNPVTRRPKVPDEVDNGDGTITVRIALSQHVYAGDTGLTLTALAGWRTGAGAQSIAVTNNSTVPAPAPIVRWADAPYQLQSAPFALEVVVASHHPSGLAPVAGVRFTVTDGTTVKTYWATALTTSTAYPALNGDGTAPLALRVYAVTVDPTTATALTRGLLRCDFKVFPWLGPAKASDTADTNLTTVAASNAAPAMTGLGTAASVTANQAPQVVAWNPGNAWIVPRFAYVDPVNGAATAAAANVSTTAATAAATPLQTVNLAIESLRLWSAANPTTGGTLAAANGQSAIPQSVDGCRIRLVAGASFLGTTTVTSGVQANATWLVIEGDPANANPRLNCILRSPTTVNGTSRIGRFAFANLSVEAMTNTACAAPAAWLNNVEVRGVAGQTTTTGSPFGATGALLWATNVKWWQHNTSLRYSGSQITLLARGCQVERDLYAPAVLNCARLPSAIAGVAGFTTPPLTLTDAGLALERLAIGNDLRFLNSQQMGINVAYLANASAPAALTLGTPYPVMARAACLNHVAETYGTSQTLWSSVGENTLVAFSEVIVEGNTFTGDRTNCPYGTGADVTIALTDAASPQLRLFRFANNITMKNANKQDRYTDGGISGGAPTGIVGSAGVSKRTWGRVGAALGVALTRNWAVVAGDELVIAGTPANVYHCTTAGTTAASGGPTGTGASITDGTAVWAFAGTEARVHGFRPAGTGMWASSHGVMYEGNIDFQGPAGPSFDPEFFFDFYGLGSDQLSVEGIDVGSDPFTADQSGTPNRLAFQAAPTGAGGGNYKPLSTAAGSYALGRAKTANTDVDQRGVTRAAVFAAGAVEGATAVPLLPAADRQGSRAAASLVGWSTIVATSRGAMPTRAATGGVGWTTTLAAAGAALASRAASTTTGWTTMLAAAAGRLASRAAASVAGWIAALAVDPARDPTAAAPGGVAWQAALAPASGRAATVTTAPAVTAVGAPTVTPPAASPVAPDPGAIAVVDRGGSLAPPAMMTPFDRTKFVAADWRTDPA